MIYEYPEEFIVPIVYANDLSNKPMHRDWEVDLEVDGLIIADKKLQENKEFIMDGCGDKIPEKKGNKCLEFDMDILEEPYQENMLSYDIIKDGGKNDHVKAILNEIDTDYAESETLRI